MKIPLKLRKSAGVRVTPQAHAHIESGNDARDRGDWSAAAEAYRAAIDDDPGLAHIWIQLGHALKEDERGAEAEQAYRAAAELLPRAGEPLLHLGHLHKRAGNRVAASQAYLDAVRLSPQDPDVLAEIGFLIGADPRALLATLGPEGAAGLAEPEAEPAIGGLALAREALAKLELALAAAPPHRSDAVRASLATTAALVDEFERRPPDADAETGPALVFDVSDLISYFRNARLPTGIQRVQIETIVATLRDRPAGGVKICAFFDQRDNWVEISTTSFLTLARLSLADGNRGAPEWIAALARVHLVLASAPPLVFPRGAYLVNLGTSWWLQNYFLLVRQAKAQQGVRYVPFVHDLIPVMASEHCVKELTQDFISWAIGAFEHADHFLVNSEATKRDLLTAAGILGHGVASEDISVIRLDADFRKEHAEAAPAARLAEWGLAREPFVLFVSTIESRKNHLAAFEAWIELIKRHGAHAVPKLVCVGNRGWLNDAVYARLDTHEALRGRVAMLSGLSDPELDLLYRSCLFTLYPSRYEGWGLPVTESLCHGKVPLISDASSLPEAGGAFAVYFSPDRAEQLTERLEQLIFDGPSRAALEARIVADFAPRSWSDVAGAIRAAVTGWAAREASDAPPPVPAVKLGAYHPIVRNIATRIWPGMRSAEIFRAGDGWWGPDDWGCWTKPHGGRLELRVPAGPDQVRLCLRLHGIPTQPCRFRVSIGGMDAPCEGRLGPGEFRWLAFTLSCLDDGALRIDIGGDAIDDLATITGGADPRRVAVGVAGFFICSADDTASRLTFVEAVATDTLGDLDFGREMLSPSVNKLRLAS